MDLASKILQIQYELHNLGPPCCMPRPVMMRDSQALSGGSQYVLARGPLQKENFKKRRKSFAKKKSLKKKKKSFVIFLSGIFNIYIYILQRKEFKKKKCFAKKSFQGEEFKKQKTKKKNFCILFF